MTASTTNNAFVIGSSIVPSDRRVKFDTVNFGEMSLHNVVDENSVDGSDLRSSSCQLSGWGSAESRKSYSCLTSLVSDNDLLSVRRVVGHSVPSVHGEGWGYFVDTKD